MHPLWKDYFALLMEFEGTVYECDPDDPGGATKYGIDQRSHPGIDIKGLTLVKAEQIHLAEFMASAASKLPAPHSFAYFDFAMNAGEVTAAKALQRAVDHKPVDGRVGPLTLKTVGEFLSRTGGNEKLVLKFAAKREIFYMNLVHCSPKKNKFLTGWTRRCNAMKKWAAERLNDKEAA